MKRLVGLGVISDNLINIGRAKEKEGEKKRHLAGFSMSRYAPTAPIRNMHFAPESSSRRKGKKGKGAAALGQGINLDQEKGKERERGEGERKGKGKADSHRLHAFLHD